MATIRISPLIPISSVKNLVYLTDNEIRELEQIQTIMPDIAIMRNNGVFNFKRGRAILHRDNDGQLRKVEVDLTKWNM